MSRVEEAIHTGMRYGGYGTVIACWVMFCLLVFACVTTVPKVIKEEKNKQVGNQVAVCVAIVLCVAMACMCSFTYAVVTSKSAAAAVGVGSMLW